MYCIRSVWRDDSESSICNDRSIYRKKTISIYFSVQLYLNLFVGHASSHIEDIIYYFQYRTTHVYTHIHTYTHTHIHTYIYITDDLSNHRPIFQNSFLNINNIIILWTNSAKYLNTTLTSIYIFINISTL